MGLFGKLFEKKECAVCGGEIGLLGNRKLEDGNLCKTCAKKLSPWFEDRRHATVADINEQLAYRARNEAELAGFQVCRVIGEAYKMYIEEINGVPTRFFVTDARNYMEENPDIIAFSDVVSCVTDIEIRDEEIKQRNDEGQLVSYRPPRFKHHHNFYINMEIRNNPYFSSIRFHVNSGVVTFESTGGFGMRGGFGMGGTGSFGGNGIMGAVGDAYDRKRYNEYQGMCQKIEQAVEDGKRGGFQSATAPAPAAAPEPAPAPAVPKFCPNCGAPTEGARFCQHCGSKLA